VALGVRGAVPLCVPPAGLADRADRPVPRCRVADLYRGRQSLGLDAMLPGEAFAEPAGERIRSLGLDCRDAWQPGDQPGLACLQERRAERRGVAEVAGGKRDPVRGIPGELLEHFEDDRLLALQAKRIDGVEQIDPE